MRNFLTFAVILVITGSLLFAQSSGDYRSAVNNGNWGTASTWETFDGSNWNVATGAPGASNNVSIRNGYDVILDASGKNCKNLIIETGATFKTGTVLPTSSIRYVRINGDSAIINGTFGDPNGTGDAISFENARVGGTVVITGTGSFAPARVRVYSSANTATTIFDIDTKLMYTGSTGTGGVALYPQSDNNTFIFNEGKTITFVNYANMCVGSSISTASAQTVTFIVKGTLDMSQANNSLTLLSATGKTASLIVSPTGSINIGDRFLTTGITEGSSVVIDSGNITIAGTITFSNPANYVEGTGVFEIGSGATLNIGAAAGLDPVNGPIRTTTRYFSDPENYIYNGTVAQVTGSDLPSIIKNLTINNAAGLTLSQNTTASGTVALTAGDLDLNFNTLNLSDTGTLEETAGLAKGGCITTTRPLNNIDSLDVAGLGAILTCATDMGQTTISRGYGAYDLNGQPSIDRNYFIHTGNFSGLNATLDFKYDESELGSLQETDDLVLFSSINSTQWTEMGGKLDTANNLVTATGLDGFFSTWWTVGASQAVGKYYVGAAGTGPLGADPDFPTLKAACDSLNASTITGDLTVYITSDLTEPENVALAVNTNGYSITFMPYEGVTPTVTYTQTTDNAGTSGAFVIGTLTSSGAPLVSTSNIVVNGSNDGSTTRDLSFVSASGVNAYAFRIRGDCDNIAIKNCNMNVSAGAYGIWINPVYTTDNFLPDNITIENCSITTTSSTITTGTPIHVATSGTTTLAMENLIVRNNNIIGRTRGVFLNGRTNITKIEGNTFEINQTSSGFQSSAVIGNLIYTTGETYILGNDFQINATANTAASNGIRVITASGGGTFIIANNFFQGFAAPDNAGAAVEMIGIRCGSAVQAYYNTFVLNNINASTGTLYRAINIAAGTPIIKNNIIVVEEDDFAAYCIGGTPGESDYNNFYLKGATNAKVTTTAATLAEWKAASGMDTHSASKAVEFISANNLHLSGASLGDSYLTGTPIAAIDVDIDNEPRSAYYPYMGADEGNIELTPPDYDPPTIITVTALNDTIVTVEYSEFIDETSAVTLTNYVIDHEIGNPLAASLYGTLITLKVPSLSADTLYKMIINNVKDISDNVIATDTEVSFTWTPPLILPDVFFSQYIEGSSNNKAIEIYNGTSAEIDLSDFTVKQSYNGEGWGIRGGISDSRYVLPLSGTLAAGDVYVIYNIEASSVIAAVGDTGLTYNSTANGAVGSNVAAFNGDDAMGLFYQEYLLDAIGDPLVDPGTNWPVAGGLGATSEYSLIRKAEVVKGNLDWSLSSGADEASSEWVILSVDDFRFLGSHPHTDFTGPDIVGCVTIGDSLVQISFSEPVDQATATEPSNYFIDGQVGAPVSAELVGAYTVVIKLEQGHFLAPNLWYSLVITNVTDLMGNVIVGFSGSIYNEVLGDLPVDIISSDFETNMGTWQVPTYSGSTSGILTSSAFALSEETVFYGTKSAKMEIVDDPAVTGGWFVRVWNSGRPDVKIDSKLFAYVKASDPNIQMRIVFRDDGTGGDNEYLASPWVNVTYEAEDWQVLSVDLQTTPLISWAVIGDGTINSSDVISIDCIQLQCPNDVDAVLYFDKLTERPNVTPVEVTLQVNMAVQALLGNFQIGVDIIDVAGSFNNNGNIISTMDDSDGDSIYSITMPFYPTESIEYKFRINSNWDTSEFPGDSPYRTFIVPDTNVVVTHWYNDQDRSILGIDDIAMLPKVFALHQNYPNPFNPITTIKYDLPKDSHVKIMIFDLMGREVRTLIDANQKAGYQTIQWNASDNYGKRVASGYYIYVMQAGDFHKTEKMILLK